MEDIGATQSETVGKSGEQAWWQAWKSTRHRPAREEQDLEKMGVEEAMDASCDCFLMLWDDGGHILNGVKTHTEVI